MNKRLRYLAPVSDGVYKNFMSRQRTWCQPDYGGVIHPRKFMVVFEDAEVPPAVFDDENEARKYFDQAIINWNCYLFGLLPREKKA